MAERRQSSLLSQAKQVLLSALDSAHTPSEQWASVQCLALAGVSSPGVVASLLQHLLHQDVWGRERAADLLTRVSRKTVSYIHDHILISVRSLTPKLNPRFVALTIPTR